MSHLLENSTRLSGNISWPEVSLGFRKTKGQGEPLSQKQQNDSGAGMEHKGSTQLKVMSQSILHHSHRLLLLHYNCLYWHEMRIFHNCYKFSQGLNGPALPQAYSPLSLQSEHRQNSSNDRSTPNTFALLIMIHTLVINPYPCCSTSTCTVN